ncbi:hypothetical protein [Georgenia thermotolerans]|uniref:SAF domain-containing protein n=1 Tax=Georgenia thermotolerans TaxID=527326 RepID=A0A7J5UNF8_9MICO|nr:hypothetical protein [Georgenia thermotolerans]KAE8763932.1 hypothetical protein GB883_11525 [Georgenia thermotolerans]
MSGDDLPRARRLRRPTWRDPRLGVGVLLVAASVALGTWAVRDAAATTAVYAARQDLTPGDALDGDALVVAHVRLGGPEERYLPVADGVPDSAVALRTVGAGELVPRAAVGASEAVDLRPVVIPLGLSVPADLGPGTVVDLWLVPAPPTGGLQPEAPAPPTLLGADLVVAEVLEDSSMFTGGTGVSVELLVPRLDLPDVLGALSSDGQLVAVPTFGGEPGPAPAPAAEDEAG